MVANRNMSGVQQALMNNKMYLAGDVGEVKVGKIIGPRELINFLSKRDAACERMINQYLTTKAPCDYEASCFPSDMDVSFSTICQSERGILQSLATKKLPTSYVTCLLQESGFKDWMQLSLTSPLHPPVHDWFAHFLEDTLEQGCSKQFDRWCQEMQRVLIRMSSSCMRARREEIHTQLRERFIYFIALRISHCSATNIFPGDCLTITLAVSWHS